MGYDFIGLEKVVRKFERGEKVTQIEEDILIAMYYIGVDINGSGKIMYKLSSEKYEKICEEIWSTSFLNNVEKKEIEKEKLAKYANSIDYIIAESMKNIPTSEIAKKDIFERPHFHEKVSECLEKLRDFKYM